MSPFQILKEAIKKNPSMKYALGVVGIAAAIAIINGFGIQDAKLPVITILILFGLMILLLIFSSISKSKDPNLRLAGYILVYMTLIIVCVSGCLLISAITLNWPEQLAGFLKDN